MKSRKTWASDGIPISQIRLYSCGFTSYVQFYSLNCVLSKRLLQQRTDFSAETEIDMKDTFSVQISKLAPVTKQMHAWILIWPLAIYWVHMYLYEFAVKICRLQWHILIHMYTNHSTCIHNHIVHRLCLVWTILWILNNIVFCKD